MILTPIPPGLIYFRSVINSLPFYPYQKTYTFHSFKRSKCNKNEYLCNHVSRNLQISCATVFLRWNMEGNIYVLATSP